MNRRRKQNRRRGEGSWREWWSDPQARQLRRGVLVLAAIALGAGGLPLVGYMGYREVVEAEYFAADQVQVDGNRRLSREEILRISGLETSPPSTLELEAEEVRERLERHPWIARARVEVRLPDTVDIRVEERALLGVVQDRQLSLVDTRGEIIKPLGPKDHLDGPIVSGFDGRLAAGDEDAKLAMLGAFALIEQYQTMGLERWAPLAEVHHDPELGYTLFTSGAKGMEVRLGSDRFEERLQRLAQVVTLLKRRDIEAEYVLLDGKEDLDRVVIKPTPRQVAGVSAEAETATAVD